MSKTYCRFCDITVQGIYLNCPRCGGWLPPDSDGLKEPSEDFELVSFGDSWPDSELTEQEKSRRAFAGIFYSLSVLMAVLGIGYGLINTPAYFPHMTLWLVAPMIILGFLVMIGCFVTGVSMVYMIGRTLLDEKEEDDD